MRWCHDLVFSFIIRKWGKYFPDWRGHGEHHHGQSSWHRWPNNSHHSGKRKSIFACLLCGKIAFYLWIPHLVAIRRHRWPTGISLRWRRWSSRWWRRAGTLLASRRNDTKDSSTATPSPRAWSSETGAPTGPSGSEPGTRTLPLWVLFMNAGLNLNLDFYVTVLILKLTDSTRLSPFLHYCFVMLHICFIQLLVYSCRLFLQENNSCILHLRSLWT